ncbi:uncharacterized protein LOC130823212 [Amaranthus tricolor]|uniref:uncharacterized protein LOC130823212 n=1 Tax=Amaranthus tricolor TaxID=29722 RepID=UPI00258EBCDE|nr:uncharacterized protein LOC130823212 [Amaranthus tricolor]
MSCFHLENKFTAFDSKKLLRLAQFFPNEFSSSDLLFWGIINLKELSIKHIELKKHLTHVKVYLLLKLVLTLPMVTTLVESSFSAMTFIKNKLHNSMGDKFLNDNLSLIRSRIYLKMFIIKIFARQFKHMKPRRNGPILSSYVLLVMRIKTLLLGSQTYVSNPRSTIFSLIRKSFLPAISSGKSILVSPQFAPIHLV